VREELGAVLAAQLSAAQQVYSDQPTAFGGQSPVVVLASVGTEREGPGRRTFGGPVAPAFYLDVYVFVRSVLEDTDGNPVANPDTDDQLDGLEAAIAQVVADYPKAQSWSAIGYAGRSDTTFVTVLDGTEYKRERIPLVLQGKP
jgi:hypothetical protein